MSGNTPPPICALHQLLNGYSDPFYVFPDPDFFFILWHYSIKLLAKLNPGRIYLGARMLFSIINHLSLLYTSHLISHLSQ